MKLMGYYMNKAMKAATLLMPVLASIAVLASCSVKEDRSPCPCWLQLDLASVDRPIILSAWSDKLLFQESTVDFDGISVQPFEEVEQIIELKSTKAGDSGNGNYAGGASLREYTVPRGFVTVSALSQTGHKLKGNRLEIASGEQADRLYGHSAGINTDSEFAHDKVVLNKQFATIHLCMEIPEGIDYFPYQVNITGNTAGWDSRTLKGVEGGFHYTPARIGANEYEFRVPRQADDSLMIELTDGSTTVDCIKLGQLIARSGFDWSKPSLEDITLDISLSSALVQINVSGWSETIILELTI